MARPRKDPNVEPSPVISIKVTKEVKALLRALHTPVMKSDTAVIINLIYQEAKRKGISVPG